jgi:hypothetical protein
MGHAELAGSVPENQLEGQIYIRYERQFKNLSLQEARLRRNYEKRF